MERLSGAWETLDAEVQVKINELIATDKEVQRLADEVCHVLPSIISELISSSARDTKTSIML